MRDLLLELLDDPEFNPDQVLDWIRRNRTALLVGTALVAALVLLTPPRSESPEGPATEIAPDETPLFV